MTPPVKGLRKILAFERAKKYSDTAVIGGLDAYLQRFARRNALVESHPFVRVLRSLPPGGYRALHVVQRRRVVEELLKAAENGLPARRPESSATGSLPAQQQEETDLCVHGDTPSPRVQRTPHVVGTLDSPLSVVGASKPAESRLAKDTVGVHSVRELLQLFPRDYEEYFGIRPLDRLVPGKIQTVIGEVWSAGGKVAGNRRVTEAIVSGPGGTLRLIWWSGSWMAKRLRPGSRMAFTGRVGAYRGRLEMDSPELEKPDDPALKTPAIWAVYSSTEGLKQRQIRELMGRALDAFAGQVQETLPAGVRKRHELQPVQEALRQVHRPDSLEAAERARRRFALEELLYIELGVVRRRRQWQATGGAPTLLLPPGVQEGFLRSLPFELTGSQKKAVDQLLADIGRDTPMNRLLEGDVGSGKTVVAATGLLAAVASGLQGAIMAPTEILAEQHFRTFTWLLHPAPTDGDTNGSWFEGSGTGFIPLRPPFLDKPVRVALLTGSLKASEKGAAQEAISRGEVDIAIGTHALVQEAVGFNRLGLAVVDEQHRFGVEQRAALREKGKSPHVLVMTATPIPRTLQLTVYGDLDITVLNEMPPGRPAVKTWRLSPQQRRSAYDFLRKKVAEGRQGYIICPLVEESEAVAAKAAVQEYEHLSREVYPELRLGLLHGRLSPGEKDTVMRAFRDGDLDILVSTAVVEVGIDVPNATVILVEGADRFGLAQLHQFRGRVRRSAEQSYCFLLSDSVSSEALERLQIMETVNDGFKLAEEDLRLRGPGEYFGTRQSGLPDLRAAKLTEVDLIEAARREAITLLDEDPQLERPEHAGLRERVEKLWGRITAEVS